MSVNGLVVMTPTSIASTGTGNSSSIGANGKVTFSSCATLSLNGVFTSSYDNYMISYTATRVGTTNDFVVVRLRASGTDATTNYTYQYLYADSTTVAAARTTSATYNLAYFYTRETEPLGGPLFVYGPYLSQATAFRSTTLGWNGTNPDTYDSAATHSTASSYDGITFLSSGATVRLTGTLTVYGFNQ